MDLRQSFTSQQSYPNHSNYDPRNGPGNYYINKNKSNNYVDMSYNQYNDSVYSTNDRGQGDYQMRNNKETPSYMSRNYVPNSPYHASHNSNQYSKNNYTNNGDMYYPNERYVSYSNERPLNAFSNRDHIYNKAQNSPSLQYSQNKRSLYTTDIHNNYMQSPNQYPSRSYGYHHELASIYSEPEYECSHRQHMDQNLRLGSPVSPGRYTPDHLPLRYPSEDYDNKSFHDDSLYRDAVEENSAYLSMTKIGNYPDLDDSDDQQDQFTLLSPDQSSQFPYASLSIPGNPPLQPINTISISAESDIPTELNLMIPSTQHTTNHSTYHNNGVSIRTSFDDPLYFNDLQSPHGYPFVSPSPSNFRSLGNTPRSLTAPKPLFKPDAPSMQLNDHLHHKMLYDDSYMNTMEYSRNHGLNTYQHANSCSSTPCNRDHISLMDFNVNEAKPLAIDRLSLWKQPPYNQIWIQYNIQHYYNNLNQDQFNHSEEISETKRRIDAAVEEKKKCRFTTARSLFIKLVLEFSHVPQVWLEFTRLEMECGEYENASLVVNAALSIHYDNELLLQKKLKIEEKLGHIDAILQVLTTLEHLDSQKSLKVMMEGVAILARLGYEQKAHTFYSTVCKNQHFFTGNFYIDFMVFEQHCGYRNVILSMIPQALQKFPKYGPLWFFCFDLLEHDFEMQWDPTDMISRVVSTTYVENMIRASTCLTLDIQWKLYFTRVLFWSRAICAIREGIMKDSTKLIPGIIGCIRCWRLMHRDIVSCLFACPENLKWKVYLILCRVCCILGEFSISIQLLCRAYKLVPKKSVHLVLTELSKCYYYFNRISSSWNVLKYAILHNNDEWKLELEMVQQLMISHRYSDALLVNRAALQRHIGAGRLWSFCIQLTHLIYGPIQALRTFRCALRHVAKSGEVWCEGARIFMNPSSTLFNVHNALKCLNYAVFFTPQYGDTIFETIRLLLITSDEFLLFHNCCDTRLLTMLLLSNTRVIMLTKRVSYFDPNYGPLWFRCRQFVLSCAKEVLYSSLNQIASQIAINASMYYEALKNLASTSKYCSHNGVRKSYRADFCYVMSAENMIDCNTTDYMKYKEKIIYGTNQMES